MADVDCIVAILQDEDDTRLGCGWCGYDSTHAKGRMLNIRMLWQIGQQVEAELIQPQVHDVDACVHIFEVNHFFLQAHQLTLAIFKISLFFIREQHIASSASRNIHTSHARLYSTLQVKIIVEFDVWPVIDQLDDIVFRADTIHTSETLDDAYRIPMNIVVDQVVAVLQVLSLRDTVCGYQHIDDFGLLWEQLIFLLRDRRKERQHTIEISWQTLNGRTDAIACHQTNVQPRLRQYHGG